MSPKPRGPATQRAFLKFYLPPIRAGAAELAAMPLAAAGQSPNPLGAEFDAVGRAVAAAKTLLDAIPESDFEVFMRNVDIYRGLKRTLSTRYGMQVATNASLKMYELIVQMQLIAGPRVRAFCNAELPGAFLVAINHYVRTVCPETNLDWVASSYYPEGAARDDPPAGALPLQGFLGDHYGIYAGNRERWLMGPRPNALPEGEPDLTGDLLDASTVAALADAVHARFDSGGPPSGATLYTSDAGIDVSADYNRQEELTARLNFGQVLAGLLALAPGGHLVTKQYTFVAPFSRSLIALVAALFDEAYVTKPLTSRPSNSEVYIVGKGFRGIDRVLADALLDRLAAPRGEVPFADWAPLLDPALYTAVDSALLRVARLVHRRQQAAFLNEAARFYAQYKGRFDALGRMLGRDARRAQAAWLAANPVRRIREDYLLETAPRGGDGEQNA